MTLTTPPSSSVATIELNNAFSLPISLGVPFACFVLDGSEAQVASVFFESTVSGVTAQTIQIDSPTSVGTIEVIASQGVASTSVSAPVVASFSGLACPAGVWTGTVGVNSDCSGDTVTATLWLGRDGSGSYVLSQALAPHKSGTCGISAFAPTAPVSYANDTLSWSFDMGHPASAEAEMDASCGQMSVIVTQTGCGVCGSGANLATVCLGTGSLTCVSNAFVFNKQ